MSKFSTQDYLNVDRYIEQLLKCKPLAEADVKALCDKVILPVLILPNSFNRQRKSSAKSPMFSQLKLLLPSVVIFTANSMTFLNYSKWAACHLYKIDVTVSFKRE